MKKNKLLVTALLSSLLLVGCGGSKDPTPSQSSTPSQGEITPSPTVATPTPSETTPEPVVLEAIEVSKDLIAYANGSAIDYSDLSVKLVYSDNHEEVVAYDSFITYKLSVQLYFNDEIYSGDTLLDNGDYQIVVTLEDSEIKGTLTITVTGDGKVYPESVSLPNEISMVIGDTRIIEANIEPSTTNVIEGYWSSDDSNIVSVDENGLLTAVGLGNATITYTVQGEDELISDTCIVTVTESHSSSIVVADQTGEFAISTDDGEMHNEGNIFTLTKAGSYDVEGSIEEVQIIVEAGDDDVVEINLNGVTMTNSSDSPIKVTNADKVEISAKKGTQNTIYDRRSTKTVDVASQGEGAISASSDLKIKGTGALYVEGNYNNGIHCTKDLTIQKLTLQVKAYNNSIKGKNSITFESGEIEVISTNGDGMKTEKTDLSQKNKQRGTITINDGNIEVYAAGDALQAAYNFEMNGGSLELYTYSFSSYTAKGADVDSFKGIKVGNEIVIQNGTLNINSYDDGLHADYGTELENGNTGIGNVTINGGTIISRVNASTTKTIKGADSIHADNTITINDGLISVTSASEGLEANFVNINGGDITISANDDGINASSKIKQTPLITVTGGRLDITMASGDTDGIDSNGDYIQTGGVVISRGAPSSTESMASGLDCSGSAYIKGGTFIQLGPRETVPELTNCYTLNYGSSEGGMFGPGFFAPGGPGGGGHGPGGGGSSSTTHPFASGTWEIAELGLSFNVASGYNYYGCCIYSSNLTSGSSYTITNGVTSYTASAS